MGWYYQVDGREFGPVGKSELAELIKTKQINGATLIRAENSDTWRPLKVMVKPKSNAGQNAGPSVPPQQPPSPPLPPPIDQTARQENPRPENRISEELPFQFTGTGGQYFKIWIVNILLSIITLGIYSAWAKVRRKQFFYANTHVGSSSFRYHADPKKILKGRLIIFAIFVVYTIIAKGFPPAAIVFSILVIIAMPWLVVRSLTFNARYSSWRNIRFNFIGTYGQAAKTFVLFPLLAIVTLGILAPYAFYRQKKFIVENSAYGATRFSFHATAKDYYIMVLLFLIPVAIFWAVIGICFLLIPIIATVIAGFLGVILYLYAFAYFAVKSSNLLYNSGTLTDHRFRADMTIKGYAAILITNTLGLVFTLGLFHPVAQVRAFRYKLEHLTLLPAGSLDQFVSAKMEEVSALGEEISDFMDFDFGL